MLSELGGGKTQLGHEAETLGEMPRKVRNLISICLSLPSFSTLKKAWLPVLWLECVPFLLWGFAEDSGAAIK